MTGTLTISLDGYTDLPPGKLANVVTYLERSVTGFAAPKMPAELSIERASGDIARFRRLYRDVGEAWMWIGHLRLSANELAAHLRSPTTDTFVLRRGGADIGFVEIDRAIAGQAEILSFGLVAAAIGTGAARPLMEFALGHIAAAGIDRVWLHTCTFDHPDAVRFYRRNGFVPYKFAIEVFDDPRLTGLFPRTAAPQIPLIE
jgi:GNAT superfamily N-acetyltransferase